MLIKHTFLAVLATASLTACDHSSPSKPGAPEKPTPIENPTSPTLACYLNACFTTVYTSDIDDANGDYVYPNPDNFPTKSLRPQYVAPYAILNLSKIDPATKVATHFVFGDFMSKTKGLYGLFSSYVVTQLQLIRNFTGKPIYVNSGYRSPGYNKNTDGAATWSRHTYGDAVDFYVKDMKIADLTPLCQKFGASFTLEYKSHIHCDWRKSPLDEAFYLGEINPTLHQFGRQALNTQELITAQSRIITNADDSHIYLSTELAEEAADEHEEGAPIHEWRIETPNGQIIESSETTLVLPKAKGQYSISVLIGGSIALSETRVW